MAGRYAELHARSLRDPEGFWAEQAERIDWFKRWDWVLDSSNPPFYRWFVGGETNACYNAVDRHVERGRGGQVAIIHDSPVTNLVSTLTYRELQDLTARFAGALKAEGVGKGDRVIIYMPMVPEALVAMLGCVRIGAIHSVVFGGFAPNELATRIDDAKPKVIVTASCGIEPGRIVEYKPMVDAAIEMASHKPDRLILLQRPMAKAGMKTGRDVDWDEAMAAAHRADCVPVEATHPSYILYTSGTTGQPKGVVRDTGGYITALDMSMDLLYDTRPGEVYWSASDVGWVVGHSYIVYAPLLHGCTTVVYEGKPVGTPDAGAFWRVVADHNVTALFTAPTALRAIKRDDPDGTLICKYDLSSLRALYMAGERLDPPTVAWAEQQLRVPVIDHWWQTETGWAITGNPIGVERFPIKPGSSTFGMPGWDLRVLGPDGREVEKRGDIGALTGKLPLPPGTLMTLWNADARCKQAYFDEYPGYYKTGDAGMIDAEGYVSVMTRTDDIINVAGHRLSTGQIEEVLASHPDVAECAVIGAADALKGELPVGFLVLKGGIARNAHEVEREAVQLVRDRIGPVAAFKQALVVDRLPKTRSGKILRGTIKKIADGQEWKMPATIDDPAILDEIGAYLQRAGFGKSEAAE